MTTGDMSVYNVLVFFEPNSRTKPVCVDRTGQAHLFHKLQNVTLRKTV